jgi:peptidoglycan/LPS O-acetylase OafA/YrhL
MLHRIPSLDGLRGIAAVAVMFFHFAYFFVPQAGLFDIPLFGRAYLAVDLFFLLSGFVMAHVYGSRLASNWRAAWSAFAVARFARIYPLFALTLLAMFCASLLTTTVPDVSFSAKNFALAVALQQQWAGGLAWNYPSWSIATELDAYVLFVFAAAPLLRGSHPRVAAAICITAVIALDVWHNGTLNLFTGPSSLVRTLAEFSLGVLLYRLHKATDGIPFMGFVAFGLCVAGLLAHHDSIVVAGFVCLILHGIMAKGTSARILNSRTALCLGDWSYGIYLWHAPVHVAVMGIFLAGGEPVTDLSMVAAQSLAVVTALMVIGLSALTYWLYEMPARRRITGASSSPRSRLDGCRDQGMR